MTTKKINARMGRPPRGGTHRRFRVVMTDDEHDALKAYASDQGVPVAELIRKIVPKRFLKALQGGRG